MVVGRLGRLGDAVDERDRAGKVLELPLADDLVAFALTTRCSRRRSAISSSPSSSVISFSLCESSASSPRPPRCCLPSAWAATLSPSRMSATIRPAARELPRVTRDVLPAGLSSAEIDAAVKERTLAGESIYELDAETLAGPAPELIVTQALCSVCAVSYDDVRALAEEIDSRPQVISLDPHTVGEVLGDARTLAQATERKDAAVELDPRSVGADRPHPARGPRSPAAARGRARVARSAVRGRPLDAAADRVRRRRGRPRVRRRALRRSAPGRRSRPPSRTS